MSHLSEKAMLVHLKVRRWSARIHDKEISAQVARDNGAASETVGRYNKMLIAREHLEEIFLTSNQARRFHYEQTLPWSDAGERILPARLHLEYMQKIRGFRSNFDRQVGAFCDDYPQLVDAARSVLGKLFKAEDYPSPDSIQERFALEVHVAPIPQGKDFRVDLQREEVRAIRQEIETRTAELERNARGDLWERLFSAVDRMAETLADPEAKFQRSLVGNVAELCGFLPKLNVWGDKRLDQVVARIQRKLAGVDPDELRQPSKLRERTANEARQIADRVSNIMAAYTGA